jgi:hypothetical protein
VSRDGFDNPAETGRMNALRGFASSFGSTAPATSLSTLPWEHASTGSTSIRGTGETPTPPGVIAPDPGDRTVITEPAAFVDALFDGSLANTDVGLPIDLQDPSTEVYRLIRERVSVDQAAYLETLRTTHGEEFAVHILNDMTYKKMQGADLSGTRFLQSVSNADLIGCNLQNAEFLGPVRGCAFLYANLEGATFHDAVDRCDFAFSAMPDNPFAAGEPTNSRLTGTPHARPEETLFGTESLSPERARELRASVGVDTLALLARGEVPDPKVDVFTALQGQGVDMSGPLSSSWRSFLYENVDPNLANDSRVKPYIFDASDGRYGSYGDPQSLQVLHDLEIDGVYPFRDVINRGLAQALLNDNTVSLGDPFNGAVTPRLLEGGWGTGMPFEDWQTAPIQWNTREASLTVQDCALPPAVLDKLLGDGDISDADKARIREMRTDGIVTLRDMAGIPDIDQQVYDALYT